MTPIFHSPSRSCISINKIDGLNGDTCSSGFRATRCFHLVDQKIEVYHISKHREGAILSMYQSLKWDFFKPVCHSLQDMWSQQCRIFICGYELVC